MQVALDNVRRHAGPGRGLGHFAIRTTDLSAGTFDRVYFESQGH